VQLACKQVGQPVDPHAEGDRLQQVSALDLELTRGIGGDLQFDFQQLAWRKATEQPHDLGAPLCKIFAAWRGITLHNGLATYDETYGYDQYGFWKGDRWGFLCESLRELTKVAEDYGIVLAMQNHGPDVVNHYQDVLRLIHDVGSPALKGCMDINIEPEAESAEHAKSMAAACAGVLAHSHFNAEFRRAVDGSVELAAGGYFDDRFWQRRVAYPAYVEALIASGYEGYINWEFCHPAMEVGRPAGIDYVHRQTALALEYMKELRAKAHGRGEAAVP
jgi:sugar phosphate isomerase/epimerase